MDSAANSRRTSNCSSLDNFSDLDHCGLEAEQVRTLKRTFDQFDSDGGGSISVDTVNTILHMMGMKVSPRALEEIVHEIDEDESGTLEFPEFIQLAAKFLIEEDEEQMRWELKGRTKTAFRIYDKSGDGYITVETLREILHEIDPSLSDDDLDGIIEEVDEDESGTVDFDEFMHMMTGA